MRKISYYILGWYDSGDTNTSKVIWQGRDRDTALSMLEGIALDDALFFVECWETCADYGEDIRVAYKST